ncbi:MAG TPA: glutathione S-transferase family protein [Geminicoccaceae bacterium]|nr:glutathione S-transferase family protein [Geminicoccaceae bacterium]
MTKLTLVIGNKNLSSWSFRPWLLLKQAGLAFEEVQVPLRRPDTRERILAWSPSGRLPVLLVDGFKIWDSLAICEFVAEVVPSLWPADPAARALARSVSAEMHSGFEDLRTFLPMDFSARFTPPGKLLSGVARDVARIRALWSDCRELHGAEGEFLFGGFTVADAMYAPVVARFVTYRIELDPISAAYVETLQRLPAWSEWAAAAALENREPRPPVPSPTASLPSAAEAAGALPLRPAGAGFGGADRPPPAGRGAGPPAPLRPAVPAPEPPPMQPPVMPPDLPASPELTGQRPLRPRPHGVTEVKPIGGGIHRRR